MTNLEKIRAMSVEELTGFLYVQFTCEGYCPVFVSRMCDKKPPCRDRIKKWLLSEPTVAKNETVATNEKWDAAMYAAEYLNDCSLMKELIKGEEKK